MSGSFESLKWNVCAHRLDLDLYSHSKDVFKGMESKPMLTPKEKSPLPEAQRRIEITMLHHAGHEPNTLPTELFRPMAHLSRPSRYFSEVACNANAIQWLASQRDAQITRATILTDSKNLLKKSGVWNGLPHLAHNLRLHILLCIYCLGHAGVCGNERADRLASTADITSGLPLGRAEVLRGWGNFLNMGRPEYHSTDRLKERGVAKRSGQHSTPKVGKIFVQPDKHCHCFEGNLEEIANRRGGARMGLSAGCDAILNRN